VSPADTLIIAGGPGASTRGLAADNGAGDGVAAAHERSAVASLRVWHGGSGSWLGLPQARLGSGLRAVTQLAYCPSLRRFRVRVESDPIFVRVCCGLTYGQAVTGAGIDLTAGVVRRRIWGRNRGHWRAALSRWFFLKASRGGKRNQRGLSMQSAEDEFGLASMKWINKGTSRTSFARDAGPISGWDEVNRRFQAGLCRSCGSARRAGRAIERTEGGRGSEGGGCCREDTRPSVKSAFSQRAASARKEKPCSRSSCACFRQRQTITAPGFSS